MISTEHWQSALRTLNQVLVVARKMAYDGAPLGEIADVLDTAEYLPRLIAADTDETLTFRRCIESLAARKPAFGVALQYVDDKNLAWPW